MPTKEITVTMKSLSPLLMHKYPMVEIKSMEKMPIKEQAEIAAYRDDNGVLMVPGVCVQRALISAATYSKGKGRSSLQRQAAACLLISPEVISLNQKEYKIDSRPVVVPATKGRILRHRPRLDEWQITFSVEYDTELLRESDVRQIIDDMGKRVGLLDFRPERKGPFGRCVVVKWGTN